MARIYPCRRCGGSGKSVDYLDAPCDVCGGHGGDVPIGRRGEVQGWVRLFDADGRHWEAVTKPSSRNRVEKELALMTVAHEDGGRVILPVGVEPVPRQASRS
jgi:hypothetical protein